MLLLVLISMMVVVFVIDEIKNGFEIREVRASPSGGNTLYVGGSGSNNYTSIQAAIDNASDEQEVTIFHWPKHRN